MAVDEDVDGRASASAPANRRMKVATMNDRLSFNQAMMSGQSSTSLKEPDQIDDMRMTHEKAPTKPEAGRLSSMNEHMFERLEIRSRKSTIQEDEFEESVAASSRRGYEKQSQHNKSAKSKSPGKVDNFTVSARSQKIVVKNNQSVTDNKFKSLRRFFNSFEFDFSSRRTKTRSNYLCNFKYIDGKGKH